MGKALNILACYALACYFVWIGLLLAPDMTWPATDRELVAAAMVCLGLVFKLVGHGMLLRIR